MRRIIFPLMVAAIAFAGSAAAQDYFPLETGNSWLYRLSQTRLPSGEGLRSISVGGLTHIGSRDYYKVEYFGTSLYLRKDTDGTLVAADASGKEKPWVAPQLPEGSVFPSAIDNCTTSGRIESRKASVDAPAGSFTNAVEISYRGNCADAGATRQWYAANVGLVVHEETSFAGPKRYELVYYRAGAASNSAPEVSFTVALDSWRYPIGAEMSVRLSLRSTRPEPMKLVFPSGQSYDLKIYNSSGEIVYTWSADKAFTMIYREEDFGPGEKTFGFTVPLNLRPGTYKAQAWLTTKPLQYLGEVGFEVAEVSAARSIRTPIR